MRAALVSVLLIACGASPPPGSAPGSAAPATGELMDDTDVVSRWYDAATRQLAADARAAATRTFASKADAEATVTALTAPTAGSFSPRPEFFGALFADVGGAEATVRRVAAYTASHQVEIDLANQQMLGMLQPLMDPVFANIRRQFP